LPLALLGAAALTPSPRPVRHRDAIEHSRDAPGHHGWWWATDQFAEASQILGDCRERELELCAAWTSQSQPTEPQNALQVREQHFDLLAIATRLSKFLRLGESTSDIAGVFVHIAWYLALRLYGAAP
jgi:hypothetical protein